MRGHSSEAIQKYKEQGLKAIFKKTKTLTYKNGDYNPANADEQIDAMDIPYPNETFDYVVCSHILDYVSDELKATQEIHRVLRPNGVAFILTLIDWDRPQTLEMETIEERKAHRADLDSLRLHGADFADRLRRGGFHVEIIDYVSTFSEDIRKKYSLGTGEYETIFRCTKKGWFHRLKNYFENS